MPHVSLRCNTPPAPLRGGSYPTHASSLTPRYPLIGAGLAALAGAKAKVKWKEGKMSESEFREMAWQSCIKRVIAAMEEDSSTWTPNSPSRATADFFINKIRRMPVPLPQNGEQQ
jgi:hypothetical protein